MPDLPTIGGGPSETGSNAASSIGISVTTGAANTKGATWTEIIAATDYASNWLLVQLGNASSGGAANAYLVDIAVGASTAEQVLISNILFHAVSATSQISRQWLFPLRVPAGARISAKAQCTTTTVTIGVAVTAISSPIDAPPGMTRVETLGAVTGTTRGAQLDTGAVLHTDVVAQLVATTGFAYRWMCIDIAHVTDIVLTGSPSFLVDVVTGAGGAEVPVISDLWLFGSSTNDFCGPGSFCFPCSIPAGNRVAARARANITTAGDRVLDIVAHGVG